MNSAATQKGSPCKRQTSLTQGHTDTDIVLPPTSGIPTKERANLSLRKPSPTDLAKGNADKN
jgi:hypothetical protein